MKNERFESMMRTFERAHDTGAARNELPFGRGDLPRWRKRGVGLLRDGYPLPGETGRTETARSRIRVELPPRASHGSFIEGLVTGSLEREETAAP